MGPNCPHLSQAAAPLAVESRARVVARESQITAHIALTAALAAGIERVIVIRLADSRRASRHLVPLRQYTRGAGRLRCVRWRAFPLAQLGKAETSCPSPATRMRSDSIRSTWSSGWPR